MQKITPCLWFDANAEEAVNFYLSIFPDAKILSVSRYGDTGPGPKGSVMLIKFQLAGQEFLALNGGPTFKFTEAISLTVNCETQQEIDRYWDKLTAGGGKPVQCGWLKDKYGLSWQITPTIIADMMSGADPQKANNVMKEVMQSVKLDIGRLQAAYDRG
jgi:predicted 3-demethylubiquinone-9 3-methyltransferase (glyoxalase superfamily)